MLRRVADPPHEMPHETLQLPIEDCPVEAVAARLDLPGEDPGGPVVLLAHGAGAPMESDFLEEVALGLAATGLPVLRFRYAYTERAAREERRLPPDRMPRLEAVHGVALAALRARFPGRPVLLAGKSMGGRVATHLVASGEACLGVVLLGYPLHPAGKPERLRVEHFPDIEAPCLFLQGTRDALCDLELLNEHLPSLGGAWALHTIEGGNHSFEVPRRSGRSDAEVRAELVATIASWAEGLRSS